MACLDTTVVLDLTGRAGARKKADALAKLRQLEHDQPHTITRFSILELLIGAEGAPDRALAFRRFLPVIERLEILEFDAKAMNVYPRIHARLRTLNRLSGVMDMLIASIAVANDQRLITRNRRHFELVPGLRVDGY